MNINEFFNQLNQSPINYYCWKGVSKINSFFDGRSDLDLFVDESDYMSFTSLLSKYNFIEFKWHNLNNSLKHYYMIDEFGTLFHLHVYYKLLTGSSIVKEYEIINNNDFVDDLQIVSGVKVLNTSILHRLHTLRLYLKNKSLIGKIILFKKRFVHNDETQFLNSRFDLSNKYTKKVSFRLVNRFVFLYTILILIKIKLRRLKKLSKTASVGIVVSVIGPDGAGKSTTTSLLTKKYNHKLSIITLSFGRPNFNARSCHLFIFRNFLIFLKNITKNKKVSNNKRVTNPRPSILKSLYYILLAYERKSLLDIAFNYAKCGNIVILDRSPPSSPGEFDGYHLYKYSSSSKLFMLLRSIETKIYDSLPSLSLVFRLNVSENQVLERNKKRIKLFKETDLEILERYKIFSSFVPKCDSLIDLDGSISAERNVNLIMHSIFKEIS